MSAPSARRLRSTARAMLPFPEPESWLDVGTGDARFPATAKEVFPYTAFDGLDATRRVERARRAERVEEAYVGLLTDPRITTRLRARYDVVSLLHHLPHTTDPREELHAAVDVLRPGGHLLLEAPDPQCAFAALLGRRWLPRARGLRLLPLDDLRAELESRGCVIVRTDRRAAHVPEDLSAALSLALPRPLPHWLATLLLAAARVLDHALAPLLSLTRFSNAYRLIARRETPAVRRPCGQPPAPTG
ncbi:methyltransferase domain-containing protein [Streptomyces sp. NPDC003011]